MGGDMKTKEVNQMIANYKPHKGFYNLSEKPKILSRIEYAKVLGMQNFLAEQSNIIDYLKKYEPVQYQKDKELSADYQSIIHKHWGDLIYK